MIPDDKGNLKQKYNLKIPNFEGEDHWPTMIRFLGAPEEQNGKINHINEERDILKNVLTLLLLVANVSGEYNGSI